MILDNTDFLQMVMKNMKRRTAARLVAMTAIATLIVTNFSIAHADEAEIEAGRQVFQTIAGVGCKTCHGDYAEGDLGVGPFIRGATEGTIRASIDATNEMIIIKTTITDEDIKAVSAYLNYLGSMQVVRTLSKRGRFIPETVSIRPGAQLQLIVKNSGVAPATYTSEDMDVEEWIIPGRTTADIEWQAPDTEGEYSITCIDCKLKDQYFVINVDANAPAQPGVAPATAQTASN
jgi:mono/diheme cytochrome c family protein